MARPGVHQLKFKAITTASSGDTELVAAVAGKRITVVSYMLLSTSALSIKFKDGSTDITGAAALAALGGISFAGTPDSPAFQTSVGAALSINLSGATQVSGHLTYIEEG